MALLPSIRKTKSVRISGGPTAPVTSTDLVVYRIENSYTYPSLSKFYAMHMGCTVEIPWNGYPKENNSTC
ncbi:hypothetical protein RSAG8_12598, partial [Rhizoctonia solani AG-8 WAC10335]